MPSPNDRLEQRKLDALKRGIHRLGQDVTTPFSVHLVGIGKAGAEVIAQVLRDAPTSDLLRGESSKFAALAVDIGDQNLRQVRELAAGLPADRFHVETVALNVPPRDELFATLRRYREFLKLEYPRYYWNPNYEPWMPSDVEIPGPGAHFRRAVSKAIYGKAYYDGDRPMEKALRRFGDSVDATGTQAAVCVVTGLGGGTGSGIVVDLARHLSNVVFGRRVLVTGIGIAPCEGDPPEHRGGHLFPVLNEIDCLCDEEKNQGVITVWGDLHRNPFTGGFLVVPQQHAWETTKALAATHQRLDQELANFFIGNRGLNLWETLRLLNWVGAPPTQHSAARTQYGARWAHVLGFTDTDSEVARVRAQLGLRSSYRPEFFEMRTANPADKKAQRAGSAIAKAFAPVVEPEVIAGGRENSLLFALPRVSKSDFDLFFEARREYDTKSWEEKLLDHSMLLELGVLLCEPAIRFEGMAGECLWGCACWVVVPYQAIRGPEQAA